MVVLVVTKAHLTAARDERKDQGITGESNVVGVASRLMQFAVKHPLLLRKCRLKQAGQLRFADVPPACSTQLTDAVHLLCKMLRRRMWRRMSRNNKRGHVPGAGGQSILRPSGMHCILHLPADSEHVGVSQQHLEPGG